MATATSDNSFCLIEEAETYFDERLHSSAWFSATEEDQHRALIQATRIFNTYLRWNDEDGDGVVGDTDDEDEAVVAVDDALRFAACEMALVLLQEDTQVKDDMEGIDSIAVAGINIKRGTDRKRVIPPHVFAMISHLATYRAAAGSIRVIRS